MNKVDRHQGEEQRRSPYGWELVLDLHGCDGERFSRKHLDRYFSELCILIKMEKCEVYFWDDVDVPSDERQNSPLTKGTSAVCFILTSTIVIHTLEELNAAYVNIFSCKEFDSEAAVKFTEEFFGAEPSEPTFIERL